MSFNRKLVASIGVFCALVVSHVDARAQSLPGAVQHQVVQAVGAWMRGGDASTAGAAIADMCSRNPGIALDIVAYAGEVAARSVPPEACLTSDSKCPQLDDLLAVLYERAGSVGSGSSRGEPQQAGDPGPAHGGNKPPDGSGSPCQATGTCGGEPPPVSQTML
jgi:hypothetical protein